MNTPQLSLGNINKLHIQKEYPEFYNYLLELYKDYPYSKFNELVYCYKHNIKEHPKCPVCGKPVKFLTFNVGYQKYCSLKCSNSSEEVQEKKNQTCLEKFGTEHAAQNKDIKEKLINTYIENNGGMGNASQSVKEKQQNTMEEKYGVKYALQNKDIKEKQQNILNEKYGGIGSGSDIIKRKMENTCLKKYGIKYPIGDIDIRKKIINTNMVKYGAYTPTSNYIIKEKIKKTKKQNFLNKYNDILDTCIEDNNIYYIVRCPHQECTKCKEKQYKIESCYYWDRKKDHTEPCTNILSVQTSNSKNTSLEIFIQNILDKHNISYITNDRTILNSKELDIYIPDKKIAIECNGIYWHSLKPSNYHINKWLECKNNGIQLISVWQDWIIRKPRIIESIVLSKLGVYSNKVYARKCNIREINVQICNEFLNENHIQGAGKSKIKLGIYYNDKLIGVMTFNTRMKCSGNNKDNNEWELTRFCTKLGTQIIGGAGKMLKYFIRNYHPSIIISFASNDISNGLLYKSLGFTEIEGTNKSYWYINKKDYKRYHRSTFTKSSIIERGWAPTDKLWKEKDIMYNQGYLQIYDSGQVKYILNI